MLVEEFNSDIDKALLVSENDNVTSVKDLKSASTSNVNSNYL